jgi:hypothetical protein
MATTSPLVGRTSAVSDGIDVLKGQISNAMTLSSTISHSVHVLAHQRDHALRLRADLSKHVEVARMLKHYKNHLHSSEVC